MVENCKKRFKRLWMKEIKLPDIWYKDEPLRAPRYTPHGYYRQIPEEYKHLPVYSSVRNSADRFMSLYSYGHWKKKEAISRNLSELKNIYPNFPDLNLKEYIEYIEEDRKECFIKIGKYQYQIGFQSHDLINFFCDEYHIIGKNFCFDDWNDLAAIFKRVKFINCLSINNDLYDELEKMGFYSNDISFIKKKQKINTSNKNPNGLEDVNLKRVSKNEWLLDAVTNRFDKLSGNLLHD